MTTIIMTPINMTKGTDGWWHAQFAEDHGDKFLAHDRSAGDLYHALKVLFPGYPIRARARDFGPHTAIAFGEWVDLRPGDIT